MLERKVLKIAVAGGTLGGIVYKAAKEVLGEEKIKEAAGKLL